MRAALGLFVVIILVGGAGAQKPDPKDPLAFDAKNPARTLAWLASELKKSREFPDGNAVAGKAAAEGYRKRLAVPIKEQVEWQVKSGSVLEDGRVGLLYLDVQEPIKDDKGDDVTRTWRLKLTYTPAEGGDARDKHKQAPQHFPVGSPPWLPKLSKGDKLVIRGTIAEMKLETAVESDRPRLPVFVEWVIRFESFEIQLAK